MSESRLSRRELLKKAGLGAAAVGAAGAGAPIMKERRRGCFDRDQKDCVGQKETAFTALPMRSMFTQIAVGRVAH